jgi:hypothetical protein
LAPSFGCSAWAVWVLTSPSTFCSVPSTVCCSVVYLSL